MINLGDTFKHDEIIWEVIEMLEYVVICQRLNGDTKRTFNRKKAEKLIASMKDQPLKAGTYLITLEAGTYLVTLEVTTSDTLRMNVDEGENKTINELIDETIKALEHISPDPIIKCRATGITKASGAPVYSDD